MEQQFLDGYEADEDDLIERALAQPLQAKIERAKQLLRTYEASAKRFGDGYWLAFSGGKDSIVCKQLAIEAGVAFSSHYNVTTIDPPELIRYIRRYHGDAIWERGATEPFFSRLATSFKGPPTRHARWCCEVYKEQGGNGRGKILGVRIAESERRRRLWKEFVPNRNGVFVVAPIAYWTDKDVWTFIRDRKLPYCDLYDEGFTRLGCVGCPLAGVKGQTLEFRRWPGYERAWRRAFDRFWQNWHGVPLQHPRWEIYDPVAGPHPLAREFGTMPADTKAARRFRVPVGTVMASQLHYWRWFEDMGSAQGLWDWWRSGKAVDDGAGCVYDDMMTNR